MGSNLIIEGIVPADEKFKKMLAVWNACENAGVKIPAKVYEFFNNVEPDIKGVIIDLYENECISVYKKEMSSGFDIDLSKLPSNIKTIRVYNSY